MSTKSFFYIATIAAWLLAPVAHAAWLPPIGIPVPSFGVDEVAPAYAPANALHYYVDNSAACTNTGNGSPATPRCTVPTTLAAGSYVEVHGGPYSPGGDVTWSVNGTASAPVFIHGVGSVKPRFEDTEIFLSGSYAIVENLEFTWPNTRGRVNMTGDHISLRHNYIHRSDSNHMVRPANITDAVIYDNEVAFNGSPGRDLSGIGPAQGTNRLWIVDNHIHDIWNDGILFCHLCTTNAPANIYIGRNEIHTNGENAIDIKYTTGTVVISQNLIYDQRNLSNSGGGPAIRVNDEGSQGPVWILFNRIRDSINGINPQGAKATTYAIGNIIYNINGYALNTGSLYAVNNTAYKVGSGLSATTRINNLELTTSNANQYVVNAATGDFRLTQNSPAIDAGVAIPLAIHNAFQTDVGIQFPLVDFAGANRPQGVMYDVGAYEFGNGPSLRPSNPTNLQVVAQ